MQKSIKFGDVAVGQVFTSGGKVYEKTAKRGAKTVGDTPTPVLLGLNVACEITVPEPPQPTLAEITAGFQRRLVRVIEQNNETLTRFKADLDKNAAEAFSWGDGPMQAAATVYVYTAVLNLLTAEAPARLTDVRAVATREALRGARYPSHSTSAPSNLMAQYKTAAWAELLEQYAFGLLDELEMNGEVTR